MSSSNRSQCYEDDEIEYVGTVTLATDKLCDNETKNRLPYLKRTVKDFPSSNVKKFLADVNKNDSKIYSDKINCNNLTQTSPDNIDYIGYSPPCRLSSIIILILMNTEHKSLTYFELRDIICDLFPHFEREDLYKRMMHKIAVATPTKKNNQNKGSQFFLKNFLDRQAQSTLVMLNPAEEKNWREFVLHEIVNDSKMKASMRKPELLPLLIQGLAKISIIYENGHPIITILSCNASKSTASNAMATIYYSVKEKQRKALNGKQNKSGLSSIGSSNFSRYDSEESLPDLSDSNPGKNSLKYSSESDQPKTVPMIIETGKPQTTGMYSNISTKSTQLRNHEASTSLDQLELIQSVNMDDKLSEIISSRKDHLLQNESLSNKDNKFFFRLDRSKNTYKRNHKQSNILTVENSLNSFGKQKKFYSKKIKSSREISQCITVWKKHFPWMQYITEQKIFHCKTCNWLSHEKSQSEVFKINSAWDVYYVAAKLRLHNREEFHIISTAKYEELAIQCKYQYIALKEHLNELSSENEVINFVESTAERKLYTMQSIISSDLSGMAITTRLLAEYIEDNLFNSLKSSSFFSVLALEEKGYSIVRWLDDSLDPVEHFFCSRLRFPDDNMSSLEYLEKRQVDLSKLISYSKYPNMKSEFKLPERMVHFERSASPVRIPTISICLEWLNNFTFLHQIYLEVSFVCKISKNMPHKFYGCPKAKILANVKDPESPEILLEQETMKFFFDNIKVLKDIARSIYTQTGNLEALGFNKSLFNYVSIKKVISILVEIDKYLQEDHHKLSELNEIRIKLLDIENYELGANQNEDKYQLFVKQETKEEQYVADKDLHKVIGILDMYLSYVALALSSPSEDIVEDYQRYCKCSKSEDVESVLYLLDTNSLERLSPSIIEMRLLFNNYSGHDYTILEIIKKIKDQPLLQDKYSFGWKLMQAVAVLPFLPSKKEQNMFIVATGEFSLMAKDMPMLIPALLYIMIEGPKAQDMDEETILSYWSNSWKTISQT